MEIHFHGTLTKEDYLDLSKLGARPAFRKAGRYTIDMWLLLVVAGAAMVSVGLWQLIPILEATGAVVWLSLIVLGVLALTAGIQLRRAPLRVWEQHESVRAHREGCITSETVKISTWHAQWKLPWADLTGYGEYRDVVALFEGPGAPIPFPKHFFEGEEDWDAFRGIVAEKLAVSHRVTSAGVLQLLVFVLVLVAIALMAVKVALWSPAVFTR